MYSSTCRPIFQSPEWNISGEYLMQFRAASADNGNIFTFTHSPHRGVRCLHCRVFHQRYSRALDRRDGGGGHGLRVPRDHTHSGLLSTRRRRPHTGTHLLSCSVMAHICAAVCDGCVCVMGSWAGSCLCLVSWHCGRREVGW